MRVVDTSAWIEWPAGSTIRRSLASEMPERTQHIIPTIVQFELALWANREVSEDRADEIVAASTLGVVIPLTTCIAIRAAGVRRDLKLSTADAIIYATALAHDADILTCDAHFKDLPHVIYVPKVGA